MSFAAAMISALTYTTLLANSAADKLKFSYFSQKTGLDISCKLSPQFAWNVKSCFFFVFEK